MNKNDQNDLLDILDIIKDDSLMIEKIEIIDDTKFIYLKTDPIPTYCPNCGARMRSKGFYIRTLAHPVLQDTTRLSIKLKQRKWHCPDCGVYINEAFPFVHKYKQSTNVLPLLIVLEMKDLNKTTAAVARQFHVSDTYVHDTFTSLVDLGRLPLPEYISIDEVFMNIYESAKYAFIIIDFETGEIVDIVRDRHQDTLENYFLSIPLKERFKVKGIISDAYAPYLEKIPEYFPNAISILDSFHVSKVLIEHLNRFLVKLCKKYKEKDESRWLEIAKKETLITIKVPTLKKLSCFRTTNGYY